MTNGTFSTRFASKHKIREKMEKIFLIKILCLITPSFALAGAIITHPGVKLEASEVREVFLGEKFSAASGDKLYLVDNKAALSGFCAKIMKMEPSKYSAMWAKKSFRDGISSPKSKVSDADVIEYVKTTPGAIGYILGTVPNEVTKVTGY